MRILNRLLMLAAVAGPMVGCSSDDGGTGPSPVPTPSVTGNWQASKFELSMVADPSIRFDFVAIGATVRMVLAEGGTFTLTWRYPGMEDFVQTGTWSLSGNTLTISTDGTFSRFMVNESRTSMNLVEEHTSFDFDNCGKEEDAHLNMTFTH